MPINGASMPVDEVVDRRGLAFRVAVTSCQPLVAEAVRAALSSRGVESVTLRWPGAVTPVPRRRSERLSADVGLLISDLDRWSRVRAARLMIRNVRTRWVVLTVDPPGPMWGACLEAGAQLVLSNTVSLEDVVADLEAVHTGSLTTPADERAALVAAWQSLAERRRQIGDRMQTLTPREQEVLRLLYAGETVAEIATILEVSPATVRSQVKAVLRKLEVNSQLGAVAALEYLLDPEARRLV